MLIVPWCTWQSQNVNKAMLKKKEKKERLLRTCTAFFFPVHSSDNEPWHHTFLTFAQAYLKEEQQSYPHTLTVYTADI